MVFVQKHGALPFFLIHYKGKKILGSTYIFCKKKCYMGFMKKVDFALPKFGASEVR